MCVCLRERERERRDAVDCFHTSLANILLQPPTKKASAEGYYFFHHSPSLNFCRDGAEPERERERDEDKYSEREERKRRGDMISLYAMGTRDEVTLTVFFVFIWL